MLIFMAVLAMGMAAYSKDLKKGTMPEKTVVEQETHSEETAETKTNGAEPSKPESMETERMEKIQKQTRKT